MSVRRIANKLEISPSTVSLALRGDSKISPKTRRRVQAEAERIGYRRDAKFNEMMARLRQSCSRPVDSCLGVLSFGDEPCPWEASERSMELYLAMKRRAERLGYRLETFRIQKNHSNLSRLSKILDTRRIEGVFCFGEQSTEQASIELLKNVSLLCIGNGFRDRLNTVAVDCFANVADALERLSSQGYSSVALVIGDTVSKMVATRYLGAYLGHVSEKGLASYFRFDSNSTHEAFSEWLRQVNPDAILSVGEKPVEFDELVNGTYRGEKLPVVTLDLAERQGLGYYADPNLLGEHAVDALIRGVTGRFFGMPSNPKQELIRSEWIDTSMKDDFDALALEQVSVAKPVS